MAAKPRPYVELSAVWGNDDGGSSIKVSRRRWKAIQAGAEYETMTWSWYEGERSATYSRFANGKVDITGPDFMEYAVDLPVSELGASHHP